MTRLWRIWLWNDPAIETAVLDVAGVIALGGAEIGDMTHGLNPGVVDKALRTSLPGRSDGAYREFVRYWERWIAMERGDLVLVSLSGKRVTAARVLGEYRFDSSPPIPELHHVRDVELLLARPQASSGLPYQLRKYRNLPATLIPVAYDGAVDDFWRWVDDGR